MLIVDPYELRRVYYCTQIFWRAFDSRKMPRYRVDILGCGAWSLEGIIIQLSLPRHVSSGGGTTALGAVHCYTTIISPLCARPPCDRPRTLPREAIALHSRPLPAATLIKAVRKQDGEKRMQKSQTRQNQKGRARLKYALSRLYQ